MQMRQIIQLHKNMEVDHRAGEEKKKTAIGEQPLQKR